VPGRWDKVKKPRMYLSLGGLALIVAAVVFVPLPYHVMAVLEVQARDASSVYVDVPGRLDALYVQPGDRVDTGKALAQLANIDLDLQISELLTQKSQYEARLVGLEWRRVRDPLAGADIPEIKKILEGVNKQLAEIQVKKDKLRLTAKAGGAVLPPPWNSPPREDPDAPLPSWSGTPFMPQNGGAYLEEGTLFCQIGNPRNMEAVLIIDQADIEFIRKGQKVDLKLDQLPHDRLHGEIEELAQSDLKFVSRRLSPKGKGEVPTVTDPTTGAERPQSTSYQARVPLDDPEGLLRIGLRGRAKVYMDRALWQTLGARFWRLVTRTFNFRL